MQRPAFGQASVPPERPRRQRVAAPKLARSVVVEHAVKGFGIEETLAPALQLFGGGLREPRMDLGRQRAETLGEQAREELEMRCGDQGKTICTVSEGRSSSLGRRSKMMSR